MEGVFCFKFKVNDSEGKNYVLNIKELSEKKSRNDELL